MLPPFAVGLRACCVAVVLILASAHAAEQKPLIGATRDQVLTRLGEPRSAIVAGNREVLFFERERIVLRDGVVTEVERLAVEQSARKAPTITASAAAEPVASAAPTPPTTKEPSLAPAPGAPQPVAGEASPGAPMPTPAAPAAPAPAVEPRPSRVEIKSVRLPTGPYVRPPLKSEADAAAAVTTPPPLPAIANAPAQELAPVRPAPPIVAPPAEPAAPVSILSTESRTVRREPPPAGPTAGDAAAVSTDKAKKIKAKTSRRRLDDASLAEDEPFFSARTYILALIVVGGGIGILIWQKRQQRLALAATAVSRTPFTAPASGASSVRFSADLLSKLEWKRFEDLTTSYYSKTGVVATRTKAGPGKPVHIKISWKGESRPFAYVQCIPQADELIDAGPLLELVAALTADDIRRGYVVTTGKFSVNARDLAEEKHITLLAGDIFLEKLNALPDAARAELMQEITTGDYVTPSCPKCEAKMARTSDDPPLWKCAAHPDQTLPVRR